MKIVYFGSSTFAVPALKVAAEHVVLVVSQPDAQSGRGLATHPTPVKAAALELGLPVVTPEKSRDPDFIQSIRDLEPDILLVAAYGQILSQKLLNSAKYGGINIHGSLLPKHRGAAPIQRSLEAGEFYTGVTLMQMDKGMDTGDIIAMEPLSIGAQETAGELLDRLAQMGAQLAASWLPQIGAGDYPRTPQNHEEATHAPKVTKEDAQITDSLTARQAFNKFRAFTPAPGAWMNSTKGKIKILKCRPVNGIDLPQGQIASLRPELIVGMSEGGLCLELIQPEGKKAMTGADFANGARLNLNDSLFLKAGD